MNKLAKLLDGALSTLTVLALVAMMLHTVANAVSRRFFDAPLDGTNELVAYWYLPIIALVGFVAAHWRREHIRVSLVVDRLRLRNQVEYLVLSRVIGILLCVALSWFGLSEALRNLSVGMTAGVTSLVVWPVSFLVPVVFVLLGILFVADIVRAVRGGVGATEESSLDTDSAVS